MKAKQLFILSFAAFVCAGCSDKAGSRAAANAASVEAIEALADYEVPVKPEYATIVALGGDTLAVTHESIRIAVPRYALAAGELDVTYSQDPIYDNFASSSYWQYISFEDTRRGDYDYNDLVIHCRVKNDRNWRDGSYRHSVSVQPVALGGSRSLKLGMLYKTEEGADQLSETILCSDVRAGLFFGNPVFPINTDPAKEIKKVTSKLTTLFEIVNFDEEFKVVWFIENGEDRLYAATTNFGADKTCDMISPDGLPYGISLTKKWDYPIEKCHIINAYPGFYEWVHAGDEQTLLANRKKEFVFPAIRNGSGNVDLWDWEN